MINENQVQLFFMLQLASKPVKIRLVVVLTATLIMVIPKEHSVIPIGCVSAKFSLASELSQTQISSDINHHYHHGNPERRFGNSNHQQYVCLQDSN